MMRSVCLFLFASLLALAACSEQPEAQPADVPASHAELQEFFLEWRAFLEPPLVSGVPDYSPTAMRTQYESLADWRARLMAVDTTGWPVAHQVDWYLVLAEMNGLDFAHRVKRPWERDPAFYVWFFSYPTDVPEREGPQAWGAIEYDYYEKPLSEEDARQIAEQLRRAPKFWDQAHDYLRGDAYDLWLLGATAFREQSADLAAFADQMENDYPDLAVAAREARIASDAFADWVEAQAPLKEGPSGIGRENYTWNLKHVHLLPYTWEEQVHVMERELARAHASLRLEEHRNRSLPGWKKVGSPEAYDSAVNAAIDDFMTFLKDEEIVTVTDYMEPAMRERAGEYSASDGLRGFFDEVIYRDPMTMRAHHYHWIDLARMREEPHESVIRSTPLRYNLFDGRAEGMATGMEEMLMHAGLYEGRPRGQELVWVMLAQRAARGLAALKMHGGETDYEGACQFASKWTPWGLLPADGGTIRGEEYFYMRQPGYGTSYVTGKMEIEKLLAEYARQREGTFSLKEFMDEFNSKGVIPVSLIYWEMTGDKSMLEKALN